MDISEEYLVAKEESNAGHEVTDYYDNGGGQSKEETFSEMNLAEMNSQSGITEARAITCVLLVVIATMLIFKCCRIKTTQRSGGAINKIKSLKKMHKQDEKILNKKKQIKKITTLVENSPFRLAEANKKELQYKLKRADIRDIDGNNIIKAESYNAIHTVQKIAIALVAIVIALLISAPFGLMILVFDFVGIDAIIKLQLDTKVNEKDDEIKKNFASMYLMLHYELLRNSTTPIDGILKSWDKTTESEEMHRFIDTCIHYIDTYGDYIAATHIAEEYKGIPQVTKLMRMIRQAGDGGDIKSELMGFRNEIINEEVYRMELKKQKSIALAQRTSSMMMIILVQAVISALLIFCQDLLSAATAF